MHLSFKEAEYRSLTEVRESIGRYLEEHSHDRPHHGVKNRTPHEAFLAFAVLTENEALTVLRGALQVCNNLQFPGIADQATVYARNKSAVRK